MALPPVQHVWRGVETGDSGAGGIGHVARMTWRLPRTAYARGLWVVVVVYLILFGALLIVTKGIPYGLDNNESFSSIIHARNMAEFGLTDAFGLTDESYGLTAASHPFVYTHQGNFPRFFALLLQFAGLQSAAAQIVTSTLLLGLLAVVLAYDAISRLVTPMAGLVLSLILTTDFLMVGQWLSNSWHVWNFSLFFAAMWVAVRGSRSSRPLVFAAAGFGVMAISVYTEMVFGVLVLVSYSVLVAWFLRRRNRTLLSFVVSAGLGAFLGLGTLALQVIMYLGWDGFVSDVNLTFTTRNGSDVSGGTAPEAYVAFARDNNLVYWHNAIPAEWSLRDPLSALTLFGRFNLLPYSIPLITVILVLVLAFAANRVASRCAQVRTDSVESSESEQPRDRWKLSILAGLLSFAIYSCIQQPANQAVAPGNAASALPTSAGLAVAAFLLVLLANSIGSIDRRLARVPRNSRYLAIVSVGLAALLPASLWAFRVVTSGRTALPGGEQDAPASPQYTLLALAITAIAVCWALLLVKRPDVLGPIMINRALFWTVSVYVSCVGVVGVFRGPIATFAHAVGPEILVDFATAAFFPLGGIVFEAVLASVAIVVGLIIVTMGVTKDTEPKFSALTPLLGLCGAAAAGYAVAYGFSPGYVLTGYATRYAPLGVFVTLPLITLGVTVLLVTAKRVASMWMSGGDRRRQSRDSLADPLPESETTSLTVALAPILLIIGLVGGWLVLQAHYVQALNPARFVAFFDALSDVQGRTSVSNAYAAPISVSTHQWSFLDNRFFSWSGDNRPTDLPVDDKYLWFADAQVNQQYRKPDLFVCLITPGLESLLSGSSASCNDSAGVRAARSGGPDSQIAVDRDSDKWAIIDLAGQ